MEIDLKSTSSPMKFYGALILSAMTMLGAGTGTSYVAANRGVSDATVQAARDAAEAAVEAKAAAFANDITALRSRLNAAELKQSELSTDIKWIRDTLTSIDRKLERQKE